MLDDMFVFDVVLYKMLPSMCWYYTVCFCSIIKLVNFDFFSKNW
jgi:hypothetical protein